MKESFLFSLALVSALLTGRNVIGADVAFATGGDGVFQDSGDAYHGKGSKAGGGAFADAEINFMKFYQTDGVGPLLTPNRFNHEAAPRVTIGYVGAGGFGVRVRYWNYSYTAGPDDRQTAVDTYNIDAELFERIDIGSCTSAEWSAGVRYNDFRHDERILGQNDEFGGLGLLLGMKINRDLGPGSVYGRGRWAILTDTEANNLNGPSMDTIGMHTEIGLGYELSRCLKNGSLLTARLGYEYQYWSGYGVSGTVGGMGLTGIGFDGVVIGASIER